MYRTATPTIGVLRLESKTSQAQSPSESLTTPQALQPEADLTRCTVGGRLAIVAAVCLVHCLNARSHTSAAAGAVGAASVAVLAVAVVTAWDPSVSEGTGAPSPTAVSPAAALADTPQHAAPTAEPYPKIDRHNVPKAIAEKPQQSKKAKTHTIRKVKIGPMDPAR